MCNGKKNNNLIIVLDALSVVRIGSFLFLQSPPSNFIMDSNVTITTQRESRFRRVYMYISTGGKELFSFGFQTTGIEHAKRQT